MTYHNIQLLTLATLLSLLTACGNDSGSRSAQDSLTATNIHPAADTVPVFILRSDTLTKTLDLPGELLPYEQTDLFARVPGYVRTMKIDLGDRVRKGQPLAVIEAPELNSRYAEAAMGIRAAHSKWITSKDNYNRLLRASQSPSPGIVAPVDLEHSRNQADGDSALYEAARQQARAYQQVAGNLTITAPFDGVITARKADPGALVGAGALLLTVQNNNHLRLRVAVPERYLASAGNIRTVPFTIDTWPGQTFTGMLTRKTETIDPTTRTELWEFSVDNTAHLLKAGAFANVKIDIRRHGLSFIIPPSAITTTLERKFVIRISQGKVEWVDIHQGLSTDAGMEVFGQLRTGDTLLVKSTDERKPGSTAYWKLSKGGH